MNAAKNDTEENITIQADKTVKIERAAYESIVRNMSEGMMYIDHSGTIIAVNPAAEKILDIVEDSLVGTKFAACFFNFHENDSFCQCIMDVIVQGEHTLRKIVPYYTGTVSKWVNIATSFLKEDGRTLGIIVVFHDVTDLIMLEEENERMAREAVEFLQSFVRVMVTAIDLRSPYNANHAKNMVEYGKNLYVGQRSRRIVCTGW